MAGDFAGSCGGSAAAARDTASAHARHSPHAQVPLRRPRPRGADRGTGRAGATAAQPAAECVLPVGGDAGAIDFKHCQRPVGTIRALMLFVRVKDAHPGGALPDLCSDLLDDAGWGADDPIYVDTASGLSIQVLSTGDTARIRVARTTTWTPPDVRHTRTLAFRATRASNGQGVFTGTLTTSPAYTSCKSGRAVELQKYVGGKWVVVKTLNTSISGGWTFRTTYSAGRYRLRTGRATFSSRPRHICLAATSTTLTLR